MLPMPSGGRAPVCLMRGRLPRRFSPRFVLAAPRLSAAITPEAAVPAGDGAEGLQQAVRQLLLERDTVARLLAWSIRDSGAMPPGCFME
jgi:hypothetical protein